MGQEFTPFCETETKKQKVDSYKCPVFLEDVDIDNILMSNKISSGEKSNKYFIGYLYDDCKINLLDIMLLKIRVYVKKNYDRQIKWMYFLVVDDDLCVDDDYLVRADIKKEFDDEPVYNRKIWKTAIKFYRDKVTDFHDKEMPMTGFNHTCLAVITIDPAFKKMKTIICKCF